MSQTEISTLTNESGTTTVKVLQTEDSRFIVDYLDTSAGEEGLFVQTGYYNTVEEANAKAGELLNATHISGEMLEGSPE
jgi:ribosomal protein S24E